MLRIKVSLIVLAAVLCVPRLFAATEVQHDFTASAPAGGVRRVILEIPGAGVAIRNGSADAISVDGHVRRAWKNEKQRVDAQRMVDDSSIEISVEGTTAVVRRKFGPNAQSRTAKGSHSIFEFTIHVPEKTDIQVRQDSGEIDIEGHFGQIDLNLSKGDAKVRVPKSSVKELIARTHIGQLTVNLGDRVLDKEGLFPGTAHYLNEGGESVLTVLMSTGEITIDLTK